MHQLVKQLKLEYAGLAMSIVQRFGSCCSREVFDLRHFPLKNVGMWEVRCDENFSVIVLRKGDRSIEPVFGMVVTRSIKNYVRTFRTEGAALEKIVQSEIDVKT